MSASTPIPTKDSPPWWETVVALAFIAALQMATVFNPMVVEVDAEEMFNAGQAWQWMECSTTELFRLQYRHFCGGCTLNAVLGSAYFGIWERSWLIWKLVPLSFVLLMASVGSRHLHRVAGRPAAWAFLALIAFPPRAWMHLSLIGWGNHLEAGCVALCAMVLLLRTERQRFALVTGLVLGLCTWISFSGVYASVAALAYLCLIRRHPLLPGLLVGILVGLSPWLIQILTTGGDHPFETIYEAEESYPSPSRIPYKLSTLLMPRQLVALFGMPDEGLGWYLAWGWASTLGVCITVLFLRVVDWLRLPSTTIAFWNPRPVSSTHPRDHANRLGKTTLGLLLFGGSWLAIYCVVRFQVYDPPAPEIAYPGSTRYAAPIYPMCFFAIALVMGIAWKKNPRLALAVIFFPILTGLQARWHAFSEPFPATSVSLLEPVDWEFFRPQFELRYEGEDGISVLNSCETDDRRTLELHAYSRGRSRTAEILRDIQSGRTLSELSPPDDSYATHWWEGVGEAIEMHHRNEPEVLLILRQADALLSEIPDANGSGRARALYAVALQSMNKQDPWIRARDSHDDDAVQQIHDALESTEATIADAAWRAHGREWAKTIAGFYTESRIHLPERVSIAPPAFFEGIGQGLGERWGPATEIPRPENLPAGGETALREGYRSGVEIRWLDAENQGLPQLIRP